MSGFALKRYFSQNNVKIFCNKVCLVLVFDCVCCVEAELRHPGAGPGSRDQPNLEMLREELIMQDI